MKKQYLTLAIVGCSLLCYLNSCINKDYDWDNLNKEVTFQIGNVPLGNISPIRIDSILGDRGSVDFIYDDAGNVLLQYNGDIKIDIPEFKLKKVEDKKTKENKPYLPAGQVDLPLQITPKKGELPYSISEPETSGDKDWEIEITAVEFTKSELFIDVYLEGITFDEQDNKLNIDVEFPNSIKFTDNDNNKEIGEDNKLTLQAPLGDIKYGKKTFGPYNIKQFDYNNGEENILYNVVLEGNSFEIKEATTLNFYMVIRTENLEPLQAHADAKLFQKVYGNINDVQALNDIFQENDNFVLNNPGMVFYMQTNMAFDFNILIDELASIKNSHKTTIYPVPPRGMDFPAENVGDKIGYYIANLNDSTEIFDDNHFFKQDLNPVINTKPDELTYEITARTKGGSKQPGIFPFNDPNMEANYLFNIPFDFKEISVTFEEVMNDVFSDDVAEKLFNNDGEFIIAADEVFVQLGGANAPDNVTLDVTASVYDAYDNPISIDIKGATLKNGTSPLEIIMTIKKEDTEKMKRAKHIGFSFKIKGKNVKLNKTDHIEIKKLKFKTTGGISWEL